MNDFYTVSGSPSTGSQGSSSVVRGEFNLIKAAFDKLAGLTGNSLKVVRVNSGESGFEAVSPTGTGLPVAQTSPTLITPALGVATGTSLALSGALTAASAAVTGALTGASATVTGQLTSTVAIGTAPLVITSTTRVSNLNVARAALADSATIASAMSLEAVTVPSFVNSWLANEDVSFYKDGSGIVHLQGTISNGASGSIAFTLPSGYRPTIQRTFSVVDSSNTPTNDKAATVVIGSDGTVTINSAGPLNTGLILNGITFRTT